MHCKYQFLVVIYSIRERFPGCGPGLLCKCYGCCLFQTQTNMYEVVMEMNSRQLLVEQRVDNIEDSLRGLKVL